MHISVDVGDAVLCEQPAVTTSADTMHVAIRASGDKVMHNALSFGSWTGWQEVPGAGLTLSTPAIVHLDPTGAP